MCDELVSKVYSQLTAKWMDALMIVLQLFNRHVVMHLNSELPVIFQDPVLWENEFLICILFEVYFDYGNAEYF